MREIRPSGSEGGVGLIPHPYPYPTATAAHTRPDLRNPGAETRFPPQSRQKPLQSCLIKPHQGILHKKQTPPCHRPSNPEPRHSNR